MEKEIIDLYKKEFENIKCSKEYYNNLSNEEKNDIIISMFYTASENIDEDWLELRDTEMNNIKWYDKYYDTITNLYKKYMTKY